MATIPLSERNSTAAFMAMRILMELQARWGDVPQAPGHDSPRPGRLSLRSRSSLVVSLRAHPPRLPPDLARARSLSRGVRRLPGDVDPPPPGVGAALLDGGEPSRRSRAEGGLRAAPPPRRAGRHRPARAPAPPRRRLRRR